MRILYLTHRMPFPPNKGDKIRSHHVLRHLARRHEVYLATLIDDSRDLAFLETLKSTVADVLFARIDGRGRKLAALVGLLCGGTATVRYFYSSSLQAEIDALLDREAVDAVVCSSSPTAEYLFRSRHWGRGIAKALKLMDLIDVDSYKWKQYALASPPWEAWIYRHESRRLAVYEREILRRFDHVLLVSEQEKRYFPGDDDAGKLCALSNGVDLEFFAPRQESPASLPPTLIFTGMMDYWPNVDGMKWFVREIYPRVRSAVPNVRLLVVGGRPGREVRQWSSVPGITVTGFVQDVRDYLGTADVCVVPLRIARGVQNKVLEAMAMGKAAVVTPQALEGITASPSEDLLVADDAQRFADEVIALLLDPAKRALLGKHARRRVERDYSWDARLGMLDSMLGAKEHAGLPERQAVR